MFARAFTDRSSNYRTGPRGLLSPSAAPASAAPAPPHYTPSHSRFSAALRAKDAAAAAAVSLTTPSELSRASERLAGRAMAEATEGLERFTGSVQRLAAEAAGGSGGRGGGGGGSARSAARAGSARGSAEKGQADRAVEEAFSAAQALTSKLAQAISGASAAAAAAPPSTPGARGQVVEDGVD